MRFLYRKRAWAVLALVFHFLLSMGQTEGLETSVPIHLMGKHVLVKVSVNGQAEDWFVFDSGASHNMIDGGYANAIGLDVSDSTWVAGFSGKKRTATSAGNQIQIGASVAGDMSFTFVKNLDPSGRVKGYLGGSFLRQKVVALDYQNKCFEVYSQRNFKYSGPGEQMNADHTAGVPAVQASVFLKGDTLLNGWFFIDTGASASVLCNPWVEKAYHCVPKFDKTHEVSLNGYGGGFRTVMGRSDSLHLGRLSLSGVPVQMQVTDAPASPSTHSYYGFIGADVLGRCKVFFDYQRLRVILEPNGFMTAPFQVKPGGFTLGYRQPNNQVVIKEVGANTPCEIAGLKVGDVLVEVNGVKVSQSAMPGIMQMLMQMGHTVNVSIQREGTAHLISFVLEDVV